MTKIKFARYFVRNVKRLSKKYPHIRQDVDPFIEQLRQGETPGDAIPGVGFTVFKARLANRDARRGTRGGYRLIYYVQTVESLILLTIYVKSEQSDLSPEAIRRIVEEELR